MLREPQFSRQRLPDDTQHLIIIGANGSGKTVAGLWHLSQRNFERMPWIVYDFKDDEHLNAIERAEHVGLDFVPKAKDRGIFIVHPRDEDEEALEAQMGALWERQNVGVYVDEGYYANNSKFRTILRTGRSRHVPVIVLYQRPVWGDRFSLTEAKFYQIFEMNDERDWDTIRNLVPIPDQRNDLPRYWSWYYDQPRKALRSWKPVPSEKDSLERIDAKLEALQGRPVLL